MAGTDKHQNLIADGPVIVLVEPQLGENIGAAARAIQRPAGAAMSSRSPCFSASTSWRP